MNKSHKEDGKLEEDLNNPVCPSVWGTERGEEQFMTI